MGKPIVIARRTNPEAQEKQVLSFREAYEFLGVSKTFFQKIKDEIPHVRRGRIYLFRRQTLLDWLDGKVDEGK